MTDQPERPYGPPLPTFDDLVVLRDATDAAAAEDRFPHAEWRARLEGEIAAQRVSREQAKVNPAYAADLDAGARAAVLGEPEAGG